MAVYVPPGPLSIVERRILVERLRKEAAESTAEADRIEAGIKADEDHFVALLTKLIDEQPIK